MTIGGATTERLRVLFVNENIGGHATVQLGLRSSMRTHPDVAARFVDVPGPGPVRRVFAARIPGLGRSDLDLQPLRAQLGYSAAARRLLAHEAARHDVLHVYTQQAALLSTAVLGRVPSVVSTDATGDQVSKSLPYRLPGPGTKLQNALRRPLERRVFRAATMVVAKSEWAARSLRDDYRVPAGKLRVIPLGIRVVQVPRAERDGLPIVTFAGTTLWRKGGERLLRVFRERLRGSCELHLVTHDPVALEEGVYVHDDFVPGDPRLLALLSRTAVFAFPTEIDSFGNSVLEAMAAGVPVVATRIHALPEIVEEGVTGLLVEPDDAALGAAIARLVSDPTLRDRMGRAGRERVRERFDARVTTAALIEVLRHAHEAHPR